MNNELLMDAAFDESVRQMGISREEFSAFLQRAEKVLDYLEQLESTLVDRDAQIARMREVIEIYTSLRDDDDCLFCGCEPGAVHTDGCQWVAAMRATALRNEGEWEMSDSTTAIKALDIAYDAVQELVKDNAELSDRVKQWRKTAWKYTADIDALKAQIVELTEENKALSRNSRTSAFSTLLECVRWYAAPMHWGNAGELPILHGSARNGYYRAELCLKELGLLDTDDRSGEGC